MKILISLIIGYLIGSIPWGVVIGKIFYHKDIREYGSGNSGGTNAGRVLGRPIGIIVILLDRPFGTTVQNSERIPFT